MKSDVDDQPNVPRAGQLRIKEEIDRLSQEIRAELGFTENAIRQRSDAPPSG